MSLPAPEFPRMTPVALRAARATLNWTQDQLSEALGVSSDVVRKWLSGRHKTPAPAQKLIETWLAHPATRPQVGKRKRALRNVA